MARTNSLTNFLTDVADAIKEKKGDSTDIPASNFDTEIMNLPSQGTYQQKQITIIANETQNITPDQGYDALSQVQVITQVPQQQLQTKNYTFTQNATMELEPDTGYDGFSKVGVTVNVSGGIDPSDATATANDILAPKTAYVNGGKVTGTIETSGHYSNIQTDIQSVTETCNNFCITNDQRYIISFGTTIDVIEISTGNISKTFTKTDLNLSTETIRGVYISNVSFENNKYYLIFTTTAQNTAYIDVCYIDMSSLDIIKLYQKTISIAYRGFVLAMSKSQADICAIITRTVLRTYRITTSGLTQITNVSISTDRVGGLDFQKHDTILVSNGNYIHDNSHNTYYAKLNSNFEIVFNTIYSTNNTNIAFFNNSNECLRVNTDLSLTLCNYVDNGNSFTIIPTALTWVLPSNKSKNVYINNLDNLIITQDYTNGKIGIFQMSIGSAPILLTAFDGPAAYYDLASVVPFWLGKDNYFVAGLKNGIIKVCNFNYGTETIDTIEYDNRNFYNPYNANVSKNDIIENKIAYNQNGIVIGAIPDNGTLTYSSNTIQQTIPAGYTSGGTIDSIQNSAMYVRCLNLSEEILGNNYIPYTRLDYIEASTGQYLSTNISLLNYDAWKIELDYQPTAVNYNYNGIWGVASGANTWEAWIASAADSYARYNGVKPSKITLTTNRIIYADEFTGTALKTYINGTQVRTYNTSTRKTTSTLNILRASGSTGKAKLYKASLYADGDFIAYFIPVLDDNDVPALYEVLSKTLNYSASGTFIPGNIIE